MATDRGIKTFLNIDDDDLVRVKQWVQDIAELQRVATADDVVTQLRDYIHLSVFRREQRKARKSIAKPPPFGRR